MKKTIAFAAVILLSLSTAALAGDAIKNWAAPSTWTPPSAQATGRSALTTYPPLPFIPITPCRVADTRGNGFSGAYGPPNMAGGASRNFTITGQCGIPVGAQAVSFNFTVWNTLSFGDLKVYPTGGTVAAVSTLNWNPGMLALANAAVVPLGTSGQITTVNEGGSPIDLFIDVNGYYTTNVGASNFWISSSGGYAIIGQSSTNVGVWGTGPTHGVFGQDTSGGLGDGVYGLSSAGYGVRGLSSTRNGVWAESTNQDGLFASGGRDGTYSTGVRHGVQGTASSTTGNQHFGVIGRSASTGDGSAGVFGVDSSGYNVATGLTYGVLGGSTTGIGVFGNSRHIAVLGYLHDSADAVIAYGLLGTTLGTSGIDSTMGPWGVFSQGNFGASGSKHFVEPHPTDAKKVILYSSLEGREVGTYFRGTASIVNHEAVIVIPEDFRMVTDEDGLTVQVTPIGAYSQVYVESQDLNQIVIRGSQDVQFHYMVNGVRRAFKNFEPVQTGYIFMPQSPSDRMPLYLTEEAKKRLISNGTYNPDGTVNMATAERAGFTKIWADREAEAKAAAEKNAKANQ